jgi:signal transduction histidine kinase
LGECIQDIRNLSKTLITEQIIHFGLAESIEREVLRIKKLKLLKIEFITQKQDIDISPKHGLILFRIIQESINNILKHSRAKMYPYRWKMTVKHYISAFLTTEKVLTPARFRTAQD